MSSSSQDKVRNCTYLPAAYHTFLLRCVLFLLYHLITILGVEKNNDNCKRNYFSSNRHCGPKEILIAEKLLERMEAEGCQRKRRSYQKHSSDYWETGIREARREKEARHES